MIKPSTQDYRTADAMIEYFRIYEKLGQRESEKGAAKKSNLPCPLSNNDSDD